ncbi:MAG: hypothetical protein ABJC09_13750 [Terriglobia bacterium]
MSLYFAKSARYYRTEVAPGDSTRFGGGPRFWYPERYFFTVLDSVVVVLTVGELGSVGSAGVTSTLLDVLDSTVAEGAAAGVAAGVGADTTGAGLC